MWVFDANAIGNSLGSTPLTIVTLFTDTPRALAVTPDGARVYAAGFHTGNQTSIIGEPPLPDGFGPDGAPGPAASSAGQPAPDVGTIVKWDGAHWRDPLGRPRDEYVKLSLPDKDVFVLDAMASPPQQLAGAGGSFRGVGTILYAMTVNPVSGKVYVANTEANNIDRFEGPGTFTGHSLRGHLRAARLRRAHRRRPRRGRRLGRRRAGPAHRSGRPDQQAAAVSGGAPAHARSCACARASRSRVRSCARRAARGGTAKPAPCTQSRSVLRLLYSSNYFLFES
ncbi:MAG TPA: hypothetical protein VN759_08540 [Pseudolysinimonas sp.]|nr:hypothetical protein [Pseudolysinimonas sp.]